MKKWHCGFVGALARMCLRAVALPVLPHFTRMLRLFGIRVLRACTGALDLTGNPDDHRVVDQTKTSVATGEIRMVDMRMRAVRLLSCSSTLFRLDQFLFSTSLSNQGFEQRMRRKAYPPRRNGDNPVDYLAEPRAAAKLEGRDNRTEALTTGSLPVMAGGSRVK